MKKRKSSLAFRRHYNATSRRPMPVPGLPGVSDDGLFQVLNLCLIGWFLLALPPGWRPRLWEQAILALCGLMVGRRLCRKKPRPKHSFGMKHNV